MTALRLLPNTSMVKLLRLGVSNTLDDLIEAAIMSQHQRLLRSRTGRQIMERLGFEPTECSRQTASIPKSTRARLKIIPLPKNMHPVFHEGRRKARAVALQVKLEGRSGVLYTDAAKYERKGAYTAVVHRESGDLVSCCTSKNTITAETTKTEELANALAIAQKGTRVIVSDKSAIKNYDMGVISATAAKILRQGPVPTELISLVWSAAHQGLKGNEKAHAIARGLTFRSIDADAPPSREQPLSTKDELRTFQEITPHYKIHRKIYPEAAKQLS